MGPASDFSFIFLKKMNFLSNSWHYSSFSLDPLIFDIKQWIQKRKEYASMWKGINLGSSFILLNPMLALYKREEKRKLCQQDSRENEM